MEEIAYESLEKVKDSSVRIHKTVDWSIFEQPLQDFHERLHKEGFYKRKKTQSRVEHVFGA